MLKRSLCCKDLRRYTQAAILNNVGKIHTDTGDWGRLPIYDQALALARAAGDKPLLANTLHNSGNNNLELGQPETALPYFQEDFSRQGDRRQTEAVAALDSMGCGMLRPGRRGQSHGLVSTGFHLPDTKK